MNRHFGLPRAEVAQRAERDMQLAGGELLEASDGAPRTTPLHWRERGTGPSSLSAPSHPFDNPCVRAWARSMRTN